MSRKTATGRLGAPIGSGRIGPLWRAFLWAACAFNLVIGALSMLSPAATLDARIVGLLVFAFGVVYLMVARDPARFAPVLWAGVIGKIGVVALLMPEALGQEGSATAVGILALDAAFAFGFLAFLFAKGEDT